MHFIPGERGHAVVDIKGDHRVAIVECQHATVEAPTKGGPAMEDVNAATSTIELHAARMECLPDACGINDGDLDGWL